LQKQTKSLTTTIAKYFVMTETKTDPNYQSSRARLPLSENDERQVLLDAMPKAWSVGIYVGPSPFDFRPASDIENPVLSRSEVMDVPASFVADPFMIQANNAWHMFFEVKNILTKKGEIGLAVSENGTNWTYRQIVLTEPFHLSYPYVFESDGEYYMIPETLGAKCIRLYKAMDFPTHWVPVAKLIDGSFADPSIFYLANRWWMFACAAPYDHDVLCLFRADTLFGPWIEHPQSPVVRNDARIGRPAGRVVIWNGRVIRYAQDCYPKYGGKVRALEILELTATSYREKESDESPILMPGNGGWNGQGMHHIDPHLNADGSWIACVDGRPLL
jgi:hypothetical protein